MEMVSIQYSIYVLYGTCDLQVYLTTICLVGRKLLCHTCCTCCILETRSAGFSGPPITSSGTPFSPIQNVEGTTTTGSTQLQSRKIMCIFTALLNFSSLKCWNMVWRSLWCLNQVPVTLFYTLYHNLIKSVQNAVMKRFSRHSHLCLLLHVKSADYPKFTSLFGFWVLLLFKCGVHKTD